MKVEVAVQGSSSQRVLMASGRRATSDDGDGPAARFLMKKPQSVDVGHSL